MIWERNENCDTMGFRLLNWAISQLVFDERKHKMSAKTFLWIEDRKGKSGYQFWDHLLKQLCPEVFLESKKNNSELIKAVRNIQDRENKYVIVFDNSFDNLQIAMEHKWLKQYAEKKENVVLMDIICFEYILLEFKSLIDWIYAPNDDFLKKRAVVIAAREKLVHSIHDGNMDYKDIQALVRYDEHITEHNIEQLSAKLLFDLTRNTGFEVSKGNIGECWIKSCCEWQNRQEDDICGLDADRLTLYEKMKSIYQETSLQNVFKEAKLEVSV